MSPASNDHTSTFDRRTALKAVAWTTPVIAMAAAAPARAASTAARVPGLNGWILFSMNQQSSRWGRDRINVTSLDARGSYPSRGLWINDVTKATRLEHIHIVFHIETAAGRPTFAQSGESSWSNLTAVGTTRIGNKDFTSYRADFTGTPRLQGTRAFIDNDFRYDSSEVDIWNPTRYIDRFVTIDGKVFSFRRLVGGDNALLPTSDYTPLRGARSAAVPTDASRQAEPLDATSSSSDEALLVEELVA